MKSDIVTNFMCMLWRYFLLGIIKTNNDYFDLGGITNCVNNKKISSSVRFNIKRALQPFVEIKRPFFIESNDSDNVINKYFEYKVVLRCYDINGIYLNIKNDDKLRSMLEFCIDDIVSSLNEALYIIHEFEAVVNKKYNCKYDYSYMHISDLEDRTRLVFEDSWVWLMLLLKETILEIKKNDVQRAFCITCDCFKKPYAAYKRVALHVARFGVCPTENQWVDWVASDDYWWLWSIETQREVMRLLAGRSMYLPPNLFRLLEKAIVDGPPSEMLAKHDEADIGELKDWMVWMRLTKMKDGRGTLSRIAQKRLDKIQKKYPNWRSDGTQRDEFAGITEISDDEFDIMFPPKHVPRELKEMVEWLKVHSESKGPFDRNDWQTACVENPSICLKALSELASNDLWFGGYWREYLYSLKETFEGQILIEVFECITKMPDNTLRECVSAVTDLLNKMQTTQDLVSKERIYDLCKRIIQLNDSERESNSAEPVTMAINHPVGKVTEMLLMQLFAKRPSDDDGLGEEFRTMFNLLFDSAVGWRLAGRVILASRVIQLFRLDRGWTGKMLLPRFRWDDISEARSLWAGFMWSPRVFAPLLEQIKEAFLETSGYTEELGECGDRYAEFLVYAALYTNAVFRDQEIKDALGRMPKEKLDAASKILPLFLNGAGAKRAEAWSNRLKQFIHYSWPRPVDKRSEKISESFALMCIAAGDAFCDALNEAKRMLCPIKYTGWVGEKLKESGLCKEHPYQVLKLIDKILDPNSKCPTTVRECLNEIDKGRLKKRERELYDKIDILLLSLEV